MKKIYALLLSLSVILSLAAIPPCNLNVTLSYRAVACYGQYDTVTVIVNNGTPPFTYHWSNNSSDSVAVLYTSNFEVTVSDNNGCSVVDSGTFHEDLQIHNANILTLHPCEDPGYGSLEILGAGGLGDLTYAIPGIDTNGTGQFNYLPSGNYSFILTDSVGCSQIGGITIPQSIANEKFTLETDSVTCVGASNGQIMVIPSNHADGPFQYSLDSINFGYDSIFTGLSSGSHPVFVRNYIFGCKYDTVAVVPSSSVICEGISDITLNPSISLYPNPVTNMLTIYFRNIGWSNGKETTIEIINATGQLVRRTMVQQNSGAQKINVSDLADGLYTIRVEQKNGSVTSSRFIKE